MAYLSYIQYQICAVVFVGIVLSAVAPRILFLRVNLYLRGGGGDQYGLYGF